MSDTHRERRSLTGGLISKLCVFLGEKILYPLRKRSAAINGFCERMADLSLMLYGEPLASAGTICREIEERRSYLAQQKEMLERISPLDDSQYFSSEPSTLLSSRLCDANEFEIPEMLEQFEALKIDPGDIFRKNWEKAAVAHLAKSFGYYSDKSSGLGLGVGREVLLYLFSNHCGRIVGIDLYKSGSEHGCGMTCDDVYAASPFKYRRERLEIKSMDMRKLDFPDETFDFVWSVSAVEHVKTGDELVTVFREVERVLKPGGHAFISSEWNMVRGNPTYQQGLVCLDDVLYPFVLSELKRLHPVTPLHVPQPPHPEHVFSRRWVTCTGIEPRPCVNVFEGGTFITPVLLVLTKS